MEKGLSFWYYLIWIGIALIIGWALLKSFGIIHSEVWEEMIPYFGVGTSLIGITNVAYKFGKKLGKIEEGVGQNNFNLQEINHDIKEIKTSFQKIKTNQMNCLTGKLKASPYSFKGNQ